MTMLQFQVKKKQFIQNRIVPVEESALALEVGEVLLQIEKFAYTANNITYAVAGDLLGYWHFFQPAGEDTDGWGVIPVWGFAKIIQSDVAELPVGERIFGYLPPASFVKMKPQHISKDKFIDGSNHRSQLPSGYNLYRRVLHEKGYQPIFDRERMLLFPLHITAFCLWDALKAADWKGAQQIVILSASSKTSTGLGYGLQADETAPQTIGVTSKRNSKTVQSLDIYDRVIPYETISEIDANIPTVIVDMSGNTEILATSHQHLGDNMLLTYQVGITHWSQNQQQEGIITERSKMFFAPSYIQKRIKDWGVDVFNQKSSRFLMDNAAKTKQWLEFKIIDGLSGLEAVHSDVCNGTVAPDLGLIVEL